MNIMTKKMVTFFAVISILTMATIVGVLREDEITLHYNYKTEHVDKIDEENNEQENNEQENKEDEVDEENNENTEETNEDLENVSVEKNYYEVYLLNKDQYLTRVVVPLQGETKEEVIKEVIKSLTVMGQSEDFMKVDFIPLLPVDTEVLDVVIDGNTAVINLSSEFLDYSQKYERKIVESIVYSVTSLEGLDNVSLQVEGEDLNHMPKDKTYIPKKMNRNFGINNKIETTNIFHADSVIIYYVLKDNGEAYYVPITKYVDDTDDKVEIIIEELVNGPLYDESLSSFVHYNVELFNYDLVSKNLSLDFNSYILSGIEESTIIDEVLYSITLSMTEIEGIDSVSFYVDGREMYSTVYRPIE